MIQLRGFNGLFLEFIHLKMVMKELVEIISSIPLVKINLPPIVITAKYKDEYFKVLHDADRKQDIQSLGFFIIVSLEFAIEKIKKLNKKE